MERDIFSSTGKDIMKNIILHNQDKLTDQLDLNNFILFYNHSTLDIFCNKKLTSNINKSDKNISAQGNGGTLAINYKATMPGYNYDTWYIKYAIANSISMKNMIRQHRVTYESDNKIFTVHWEAYTLPDMDFRMNTPGLHVFYPEDIESGTNENGWRKHEGFYQMWRRRSKIIKEAVR